ncbi:Glutarate-semialdehyde dehydrogenase DavD [Colletotrichum gloeosporioides]|uniref:Glutarate-semialdehyde dehydrogenase DavD n=1 Tax=Colletotrichum gloeosporioides TaxID=474922 RepID=A0A8H4FE82_COLGL|nr:Glutarate-semialdehyde dehydrogenase DavD [Colletotrichum gloeosporioides]KAF3798620.1 Glutarate-semialdehyde dehydrogenase DavD [Colletotrichum gloeosporioides]
MEFKSVSDLSRRDLLQNNGFVSGQQISGIDGKTFDVITSTTLETLATLPEMGAEDTRKAIQAAAEMTYGASFLEWFAGEAERTYGQVVPAANTGPRILTIQLPLDVQKISFNGSTRVWKLLAQQCRQTLKRTKLSLELDSNSPFIVSDDADLDRAVEILMLAKFRNSGQTCVTANRVFVQKGIYDKFSLKVKERMQCIKVGPGIQAGVNVGPLTHQAGLQKVLSHIKGLGHVTSEHKVLSSVNYVTDAKRLGGDVILRGSSLP